MSRQSVGLVDGEMVFKPTAAGTYTINESYHGKTVVLGLATGGQHFKLPPPTKGFKITFISGVDLATSNSTITAYAATGAAANLIAGSVNTAGVADYTAGTEVDVISFVQGVADIGDSVDLICDGTYWYVTGQAGASLAITLA